MCLLRFNNVLIRVNNKLLSILLTVNMSLLGHLIVKCYPNDQFTWEKLNQSSLDQIVTSKRLITSIKVGDKVITRKN